jgi:ATP-dependent Clp protease adaptor protein ClpS
MIETEESTTDEVIVTTTKPAPAKSKNAPKPKPQPQYKVIVLNDDFHTYPYVIEALMRVCGHSLEMAYQLAVEIDSDGLAAVWSGSLEVAELKRDQIRGFGPDDYATNPVTFPLGCYIEPIT